LPRRGVHIDMTKGFFRGIWRDKYIIAGLVNRDLQAKYRRSLLGVLWSIITPFALSVIIGTVYAFLFNQDIKVMIPMMFAGLNPWTFIVACAEGGNNAFIHAEGYLKQLDVNPQIFPLRVVFVGFINLLYSIMAFFVLYLILQPNAFGAEMLMLIPGLVIMFVFCWGVAQFAAVANLYVRDYQPLQSLALQGLFYVTPIIYRPSQLGEKFAFVYRFNPFYYILDVVKQPLLGNAVPWETYLIAIAVALVAFTVGTLMVNACRWKINFKL